MGKYNEGQIEFQKIVNEGGRLEKSSYRATNFVALDKIDGGNETYAISSRDGVMVRDATGKGQDLTCQLM
jgi:hypothetical protein